MDITAKTDRFHELHGEGMQRPRQQHCCVYVEVSCHKNSYSAKVGNGTLFIPRVHRQLARRITAILQHITPLLNALTRDSIAPSLRCWMPPY